MTSPAPSVRLNRFEGLVLAAVGVICLGFQLWLPTTHVADADYQAMAKVLEAEQQPGDVVLLAPWWTERARIWAPAGLPVVGYQGSDADPLERFSRVWVVAQPRLPRAGIGSFEKVFLPSRQPMGATRTFGNLRLSLYQNGRFRPLVFDAADGLAQAKVSLENPDGAQQPCSWTGSGHRCPNGRVVAKEWHEVHFAPYQCLKMEAPGGSTRLVVEFTAPAAAEVSSMLAGYIWEYGAYRDGISPSSVVLEIDGKRQELELPVGDELMHRLEGPAIPQGATVRVSLQSQNPTARVVCVVMSGSRKAP